MHLDKFTIQKYKSIKNPIEIDFNQNLICFVGKNGSGKTNILEAIHQFYNEDFYYQFTDKAEYKLHYLLTDTEISKFSNEIKIDEDIRSVEVECSDRDFRTTRVNAKIYQLSIKKWMYKLNDLGKKLVNKLDEYYTKLSSITYEKLKETFKDKERSIIGKFIDYDRHEFMLKNSINNFEQSKKEIINYIQNNFRKNKINVEFHNLSRFPYFNLPKLFQLKKEELYIDPLLAAYVEFDFASYDRDIDSINTQLENSYNQANKLIDDFKKIIEEINFAFETKVNEYYDDKNAREKKYSNFLELIKSTITQNCVYLDNESSLLFTLDSTRYRRKIEGKNIINKCINRYLKKNNLIREDKDVNKLKGFNSDNVHELIKYINDYFKSIVPKFDKDRIKSLNATVSDDGTALLYEITEKNDVRIPLESTSLGRRWYLSYMFLKNSLEEGDIFIVDEPASFLHPNAQKQILEDLYQLSKKNKVIFCTNSADMVPLKIDKYYYVDIDHKGTYVKQYSNENSDIIINHVGLSNYKEILINKDTTYLFVEGDSDKELFKRFMKIKGVDLSKYCFFSMKGAGNGKVIYRFLLETNAKFKFIFDADVKTKFIQLEEIRDSDKVLVGTGMKRECIEGLFSLEDQKKYFTNNKKLSIKKIGKLSNLNDLTDESIENINKVLAEAEVLDQNYHVI